MLSNALEGSDKTKAVTCLRSIPSRARPDVKILSASVECRFLFPLWCPLRQFLLVAYSVNWFKATRSHFLERAGNNDTGLFSLAILPDLHHPLELDQFQIISMVREIQMSKVNCLWSRSKSGGYPVEHLSLWPLPCVIYLSLVPYSKEITVQSSRSRKKVAARNWNSSSSGKKNWQGARDVR